MDPIAFFKEVKDSNGNYIWDISYSELGAFSYIKNTDQCVSTTTTTTISTTTTPISTTTSTTFNPTVVSYNDSNFTIDSNLTGLDWVEIQQIQDFIVRNCSTVECQKEELLATNELAKRVLNTENMSTVVPCRSAVSIPDLCDNVSFAEFVRPKNKLSAGVFNCSEADVVFQNGQLRPTRVFVMEMGDQILYCKQVGSDLIPVARNTLQDNSDVHNKRFEVQCPENEGGLWAKLFFQVTILGPCAAR